MWRALAFALTVIVAAGCSSSPKSEPIEPKPNPNPNLKPFLWQVDGPTGSSYLLGTFHIGVDPDAVLPPSVWDKLDSVDVVVFEMNTKSLAAFGLGMLPEGETLDQKMTPEQWKILVDTLELKPEQIEKIKGVKVWLLYTSFLQDLVPPTPSMDTEVEKRARAGDKRLVFLENVKEQEKILEKYQTAEKLIALLTHKKKFKATIEEEIAAYKSGDEARMAKLTLAPRGAIDEAALEEVVYSRNRAWIPVLEKEMAKGKLFFAVGASHLLGDNSVVALLRAKGYKVTRLRE